VIHFTEKEWEAQRLAGLLQSLTEVEAERDDLRDAARELFKQLDELRRINREIGETQTVCVLDRLRNIVIDLFGEP
jgi:uncharacterized coiled-coil DUF342 family protein